MPEAPQIRAIVNNLQQFVGKKIEKATALTKELDLQRLEGKTIKDITVFGKQILIVLPDLIVQYHPLMFGRIRINESNPDGKLKLGLQFDDGELNLYAGKIYYVEEPMEKVFDRTIDVMDSKWDSKNALAKLKEQEDGLISDVLIDQDIFNGLGNKGVNETLYRTQVHPGSKVGALPLSKRKEIVQTAVEFSFDYYDWEQQGISKEKFSVYKQKKCPQHQTPLHHEEVGKNGRKCHFCDECQKLYV